MKILAPLPRELIWSNDFVLRLRCSSIPVLRSHWVKRSDCYWTFYIELPLRKWRGPLWLYQRITRLARGLSFSADDVTLVLWDSDRLFHKKWIPSRG